MRRTTWRAVIGATAVVLGLAGCTAAEPGRAPATIISTVTTNVTTAVTPPRPTAAVPLAVGPTTTADGACPFLTTDQALNDLGERLGNVTVSTSGGRPVGCTFYPASGPLAVSEGLPPATVPVISVTLSRYADTTSAHNTMVLSSQRDPAAYSDPIPGVDEAISFATTFYAADGDQDRAYTFRRGTTVVLVRVVQTTPAFNAKHIGMDVAAAVS